MSRLILSIKDEGELTSLLSFLEERKTILKVKSIFHELENSKQILITIEMVAKPFIETCFPLEQFEIAYCFDGSLEETKNALDFICSFFQNNTMKIGESYLNKIGCALCCGKKQETTEIVECFLKKAKEKRKDNSYYSFLNRLLNCLLDHCLSNEKLYEIYESYFVLLKSLYSKQSHEGVTSFFRKLVNDIAGINKGMRISGAENAFHRIKKIIEKRFNDSSLSIANLSKELSYSHSYIYAVFKKHDTTFIKTLTKYRMEEAKRLLADSHDCIFQIASKVGYEDPYYFSSCFKKYFGDSPVFYRKK